MAEEKPLPFAYQFAAGAIAGVSEILVMYPLDVVKTRVQLQTGTGTGESYNGMVDCFRKIIKNEGFSRLYRGITAPILMEAPKRATKFAANDEWGKVYRKMFGVTHMNQSLSILTGATAGATESFVVVPFELVKIRLQDKASAGKYKGMVDCVVKTVRNEGVLTMYQGLESTMWRHILWNAGYFGCIFQVRQMLPKADTKSGKMTNDLISGAIGGTVGTIVNTPMDVVKSRIQNTPKVPGQIPKYNWAWPGVVTVFKEEGFGALYKGFLPKITQLISAPSCHLKTETLLLQFHNSTDLDQSLAEDIDGDSDLGLPDGVPRLPDGAGDFTDSGDESEDSQPDVEYQGDCLKSCEPPFQNRRETAYRRKRRLRLLKAYLAASRQRETYFRDQLRDAREELGKLREERLNKQRKVETTWKAALYRELRYQENKDYDKIYRIACKEENRSRYLHPQLRLRPPTDFEQKEDIRHTEADSDDAVGGNEHGQPTFTKRFPLGILMEILKCLVVFPGEAVHVVSRLDPHYKSDVSHLLPHQSFGVQENGTNLRFLHRFLIGTGQFNLTYAKKPNELLAPLLVSKQWYYIACNLFYSNNRFCFSSLGELGDFCENIGVRVQRIQHIELLWIGSQNVSFRINERGKSVSRRTRPLSWLPEARRLKKIGVYIRESNPHYMRRKHETRGIIRHDKRNTISQPNFRLFRDMEGVQGRDNIKCLRGIHSIEYWDYDAFLKNGQMNKCIRDHNFVTYMNVTTGEPKDPNAARHAEFQNLAPLKISFLPTQKEKRAVAKAIRMERESGDLRPEVSPDNWPQHGSGGINGVDTSSDHSDDDDDDDDEVPYFCGGQRCYGVNAAETRPAANTTAPAAVQEPFEEMAGDQHEATNSDAEMADANWSADVDDDMYMADADGNGDEDNGYESDTNLGAPLSSPRLTAPAREGGSSPLAIDGASPARDSDPGQSQTVWRFSSSDRSVSKSADREQSSLFVQDDQPKPEPLPSWVGAESSDEDEDDGKDKN
ncbi:hypothetical protein V2A60_006563 [Cordyceps javanica]